MHKQISSFAVKYGILAPQQHGFQANKSIETASCSYLEYIYTQLDSGKYVISLLFDLSKAFDSISKEHFKEKIYAMGIKGITCDWILSYMTERKLQVRIENTLSDIYDVGLCVPQGSVLDPLLFLLYVNDLPKCISSGAVIMFADDTTITVSGYALNDLQSNINIAMHEFSSWCQRNRLILNENKIVMINYAMQRQIPSDFILLNNFQISESVKLLGTYFDCKLSFVEHINCVTKQLNKAFYVILQLKDTLNCTTLLNVYYAYVYSHMQYNIIT
nr:unnamed protein product [Callosobruchus chinensis]